MKGTMCGLVKEEAAPGKFVYRTDLPIPQIGDDEVLIKVHCTAVCGTDLHIMDWDKWSQARIHPPMIPGHETAGDIVEVGKNVHDRKMGDRVSCETHVPCGTCWFCKNGLPTSAGTSSSSVSRKTAPSRSMPRSGRTAPSCWTMTLPRS